ncbi:MAG: Abi family protein [Bacteroides sp.]|nr:Abi family protein [Bacillota bacterium]MCM1393467.1 Abi family protein [[Eubacterium] siraeum]MCM1455299.1 Abi family protein [Bacteroides sp.]
MAKPFKTYDEQIQILKSRGLSFDDENSAKKFLEIDNYYSVINGYKEPFVISGTENFISDTKFEYIRCLYQFDKGLRHSILSTLLDIETMLKSIISYEFANAYGECGYLNLEVYNTYHPTDIQRAKDLIEILKKQIETCQTNPDISNDNIRHYLTNHGSVPIWVLCSHLKLGDLSRLYSCQKPKLKLTVCKHIYSIYGKYFTPNDLYVFLRILTNIRNLCAHNLRVYNYKTVYEISQNNDFVKLLKSNYGDDLKINNILSVVIILSHLSNNDAFRNFVMGFIDELNAVLQLPQKFAVSLTQHQNYSFYTFVDILANIADDKLKLG